MIIKSALSIFAAATLSVAPVSANSYTSQAPSAAPKKINSIECYVPTGPILRYCQLNPFLYMCQILCP